MMPILVVGVLTFILGIVLCFFAKRSAEKAEMTLDYCRANGVSYSDQEAYEVDQRNEALERLVLWLAQTFKVVSYRTCNIPRHVEHPEECHCEGVGEEIVTYNTPQFPHADFWGKPMPEARLMESLYHSVVGPSTDGKYGPKEIGK